MYLLEVKLGACCQAHLLHDAFQIVLASSQQTPDVRGGDELSVRGDELKGEVQVLVRAVFQVDRRGEELVVADPACAVNVQVAEE